MNRLPLTLLAGTVAFALFGAETVRLKDSTQVATLYVDQTAVATADIAALLLDGGDFTLGEGFVGNMVAARFSPRALVPARFMIAKPLAGLTINLR